jgi:hypothetical protein
MRPSAILRAVGRYALDSLSLLGYCTVIGPIPQWTVYESIARQRSDQQPGATCPPRGDTDH